MFVTGESSVVGDRPIKSLTVVRADEIRVEIGNVVGINRMPICGAVQIRGGLNHVSPVRQPGNLKPERSAIVARQIQTPGRAALDKQRGDSARPGPGGAGS